MLLSQKLFDGYLVADLWTFVGNWEVLSKFIQADKGRDNVQAPNLSKSREPSTRLAHSYQLCWKLTTSLRSSEF